MPISTNEIAQRLLKKLLGKGDTSTNRQYYEEPYNGPLQVFSNNVWTDTSKIPTVFLPTFRTLSGSTVQNLLNDSYVYPNGTTGLTQDNAVVQIKTYNLSLNPGSNLTPTGDTQSYAFVNPNAVDIVPLSYGGAYIYYITYNSGTELSFGSGDSVFDPESGILKFYTNTPSDWSSGDFVIKAAKYIGNKLSGYDLSLINTNSGSTAQLNSFLNSFYSYSSNTKTNIDGKLNITDFNSYSSNTKTQIDSKLNITDFSSYSSTTKTIIDGKLNISDFNSYSSNTLSTFNSYTANTKTQIDSKLNTTTFTSFTDSFYSYSSNTKTQIDSKLNSSIFSSYTAQTDSRLLFSSSTLGSTFRIGSSNLISDCFSTVSGGRCNTALSIYSTVSGGYKNIVSGSSSTIAGGNANALTGITSTIGGGAQNTIFGNYSIIAGGRNNLLLNDCLQWLVVFVILLNHNAHLWVVVFVIEYSQLVQHYLQYPVDYIIQSEIMVLTLLVVDNIIQY